MSSGPTQPGNALPPFSLMAPDAESRPSVAKVAPPGDTDFGVDEGYMFGEDGFTFLDFLDIINPLQHVPVVSSIYRHVTGDEIDPGARMVGSAIFGGPSGFAMAVVNNAMDAHTGQDLGESVIAVVDPDADQAPEDLPVLAAAEPLNAGGIGRDANGPTAEVNATGKPAALATFPIANVDDRPFAAFSTASPGPSGPAADSASAVAPVAAVIAAPSRPPIPTIAAPPSVPAASKPLNQPASRKIDRDAVEAVPARPVPGKPRTPLYAGSQLAAAPGPSRGNATQPKTSPLDPSLIPQAMLSALEKYEKLKTGN